MNGALHEEFELIVTESDEVTTLPGYYETRTRVYYVTATRAVYLLAAPGQRAMLHAIEALPSDAVGVGASPDPRLRALASVADDLAARPGPVGVCAELESFTSPAARVSP